MIKKALIEILQCPSCNDPSVRIDQIQDILYIFCLTCPSYTPWFYSMTKLSKCQISFSQIEKLLTMFIDNKTPKDAYDFLNYDFINEGMNIKTVRRYFTIFSEIALDFYNNSLDTIMLSGNIELDESHLFKEKKSSAPHRGYKLRNVWLFGLINRDTREYVMFPMNSRDEITIHLAILKFVKLKSKIYSDSYCAYVNNYTKESKLMPYGYIHEFICHKNEFVSKIFKEIHTNNIENLWKLVKQDLKKSRITSKYVFAISRYFFHSKLTKTDQLNYLVKGLTK